MVPHFEGQCIRFATYLGDLSLGSSLLGKGNRTRSPLTPGVSAENVTSNSDSSAIARKQDATARLKLSIGGSPSVAMAVSSIYCDYGARLRQFFAKAALVVFGNNRPFHLVALVKESDTKGETTILEDIGVLGPGEHRPRRHNS